MEARSTVIVCPDCSTEISGLSSVRCSACDWNSISVDGIPAFLRSVEQTSMIAASYQKNYDILAEEDLSSAIVEERFVENLAKNLVNCLGDVTGLDVCDLGSGKGFASRLIASKGAKSVTAVDITPVYLKTLRGVDNIQPLIANAEALPFRSEFDVVVSTDVMEHVLNLGSFLYCVNRALRPGGRFLVRVPYRENLLTYSPHYGCPYEFVHLRTFNRGSLKDCLEQSGFSVKGFRMDGFFWGRPQPFWVSRDKLGRIYASLKSYCTRRGIEEADITLANPHLARFFMDPTMILADVEKIYDLPESKARNVRGG